MFATHRTTHTSSLPHHAASPTHPQLLPYDDGAPCTVALRPQNRAKNRYTNVVPTDAARVVLRPLEDDEEDADDGDEDDDRSYVNASWLPGVDTATQEPTAHAYIATQAPLGRTIDDLWRLA